jgi:hypothetical protein
MADENPRVIIADALIPDDGYSGFNKIRYVILGNDSALLPYLPTSTAISDESISDNHLGKQGRAEIVAMQQHRRR